MQKKVLITGGSGLLAVNWALSIRDNYAVTLLLHHKKISMSGVDTDIISLSSLDGCLSMLTKHQPDIVIHTVGLTSIEGCEINPELARYVNVIISNNMAEACYKTGVQFVCISTDHLFQGITPFMKETDAVSPLNIYGITKAEAEVRVIESNPNALIVRTNFYGWGSSYRRSFSDMIIDNLRGNKKINLFCDVYFTPILIDTLVNAVQNMIKLELSGVFNIVGNDRISKYDFGLKIAKLFSLNPELIESGCLSDRNDLVKRPFDMSLSNKKINDVLPGCTNPLEDDLRILKRLEIK